MCRAAAHRYAKYLRSVGIACRVLRTGGRSGKGFYCVTRILRFYRGEKNWTALTATSEITR